MSSFDLSTYLNEQDIIASDDRTYTENAERLARKQDEVAKATERKLAALRFAHDKATKRNQLQADSPITTAIQGGLVDSDIARQLSSGALSLGSGLAGGLDWASSGVEYLLREDARRLAAQKGKEDPYPDNHVGLDDKNHWFKDAAQYLDEASKNAEDRSSFSTQQTIAASTPDGSIADPSSWSMGRDPSLKGYMLQGAKVAGQFGPMALGALAKARLLSEGIGALSTSGDQAKDTEDYFNKLTQKEWDNVEEYKNLLSQNVTPDRAKEIIKAEAKNVAGAVGAGIGLLGGSAVDSMVNKVPKVLDGNLGARVLKGVGGGTAFESAQEVAESTTARAAVNESVGSNRDSFEGTFGDAVLGGMGGTTISTVGTVSDERDRAIKNAQEKDLKAKLEEAKVAKQVRDQAVKTADVSTYLNKEPLKAFDVLTESVGNSSASIAKREKALKSGESVVKHLEDQAKGFKDKFDSLDPSKLDSHKAELAATEAELESVNAAGNPSTSKVRDLEGKINATKALINNIEKTDPKLLEQYAKQAELSGYMVNIAKAKQLDLEQHVKDLPPPVDVFTPSAPVAGTPTTPAVTPTSTVPEVNIQPTESIPDLVSAVAKKPDPVDTTAVAKADESKRKLISLAMISPDQFDDNHMEAIDSMLKSQDTHLTNRERTYLKQFTEAKRALAAAKNLNEVNQDILKGGNGFEGLADYQQRFSTAIQKDPSGAKAAKVLGELESFVKRHESKAQVFNQAYGKAIKTRQEFDVSADTKGLWKLDGTGTSKAVIHRNSDKLVNAVNAELNALKHGYRSLNAALQLHKGQSVSAKAVNKTAPVSTQVSTQTPTNVTPEAPTVTPAQAVNGGNDQSTPSKEIRIAYTGSHPEVQGSEEVASATTTEPVTEGVGTAKVNTEHTLPKNFDDARLLNEGYRIHLQGMADDLVIGGDIQLIHVPNKNNNTGLNHRTPSINPSWFKNLEGNDRMTVKQTKNAVAKALAGGKRLGVRQIRMISRMLDEISGEHLEYIDRLIEERERVQDHYNLSQSAGEQFTESSYLPEATYADRGLSELAHEAIMLGAESSEIIDLIGNADTEVIIKTLKEIIEALNVAKTRAIEARSKSSKKTTTKVAGNTTQKTKAVIHEDKPISVGKDLQDTVNTGIDSGLADQDKQASTAGTLSVFVNAEPTSKWTSDIYNGNFLSTFFTQQAGSKGAGLFRPLVSVRNLLSKLLDGTESFQNGLQDEISDSQSIALNDFKRKVRDWNTTVKALFPKPIEVASGAEDYRFTSPLVHFYKEVKTVVDDKEVIEQVLDENLLTAISSGIYLYLLETANKPFNDDKTINKILNNREDDIVMPSDRKLLRYAGTRTDFVTNNVGAKIIEILGIKDFDHTPVNELPRLKAAFGQLALGVMVDKGLMERVDIPRKALSRHTGTEDDTSGFEMLDEEPTASIMSEGDVEVKDDSTRGIFSLFRVTKEKHPVSGKPVTNKVVEDSLQANRNTQGVVARFIGTEDPLKEPTLKPESFIQKFAKRTRMLVPDFAVEVLNRCQKQKHVLREGPVNVLRGLSEQTLFSIVGVIDTENMVAHKSKIEEQEAINEALTRELNMFLSFAAMLDKESVGKDSWIPFYFKRSFWKNQRVGYASNTVNPQTSKIHRYAISMDEWKTTIRFSDTEKVNNFKLRVVEGLNVKTDKDSNVDSLAVAKLIFDQAKDPNTVYGKAVAVLRNFDAGSITQEDEDAIKAAVAQGGMGMHSLSSLIAIADYINAYSNYDNPKFRGSFTTDIMGEVDGVTNGPMLSLLQFGVNSVSLLAKGGFFTLESKLKDHNLWVADKTNQDLYKTTATTLISELNKLANKDSAIRNILNDVFKFTGEIVADDGKSLGKAARDFTKNPLTTLMFGSGVNSTVADMANQTIDNIYGALEGIGKLETPDAKAKAFQAWKDSVNRLLMSGSQNLTKLAIPDSMSFEDALVFDFSDAQMHALRTVFKGTVGVALKATLKKDFSQFISAQRTFNDAARTSFYIYRAAYDALKKQELEKLNTATRGKQGRTIHVLTHAQESAIQKQIAHLLPTVNTLLSKKGKQDASSGLYAAKSARTFKEDSSDLAYYVNTKFGKRVENINHLTKSNKDTVATFSEVSEEIDPGVSALVLAIHSTDSAIALEAYGKLFALNIHDALGVGLDSMNAAAIQLNENTFNAMLQYSAPSEMLRRLETTLRGASQLMAEQKALGGSFNKDFQTNMQAWAYDYIEHLPKALRKVTKPSDLLPRISSAMRDLAYTANKNKFDTLSQLGYVNQYSLEGGGYEVTDLDRQKAVAAKEANEVLNTENANVVAAIDGINKMFVPHPLSSQVGTPNNKSNPSWVEFFESKKNSKITVRDLLSETKRRLSEAPDNAFLKFQSVLVDKLLETDFSGVDVVYASTDLDPDLVTKEMLDSTKAGWYSTDNAEGNPVLGFKAIELKSSMLTTEVILHEILHAQLSKVIEDGTKSDLYNNLETLRGLVQSHLETTGLIKNPVFRHAVKNVHELVSIGLTNKKFQDEVLKQIKVDIPESKGILRTAMDFFVDLLAKAIFGNVTKEDKNTGMYALISNVAGLMNQSKEDFYGSSKLVLDMPSATGSLNTEELFDAIGSIGNTRTPPEHQAKLLGLIKEIVNKVRKPYDIFEQEQAADPALSPQDRFIQTMVNGRAFVSSTLAAGFKMSEQTAFVLEQVEAVVGTSLEGVHLSPTVRASYKTLERIYKEASHILTPEHFVRALAGTDWANATADEKQAAKDQYAYVFTETKNAAGRSDAVSRFAAMALTLHGFSDMLDFRSYRTEKRWRDMNWPTRIREAFTMVLHALGDLISGQWGVSKNGREARTQIASLVDKLVAIDGRRQSKASNRFALKKLESGIKHLRQSGMKQVGKAASASFLSNSRFPVVAAISRGVKIIADDRAVEWLDTVQDLRDRIHKNTKPGIIAGIFNELRSLDDQIHDLTLLASHNEQLRKQIKDGGKANAKASFADGGEQLTETIESNITEVLLHTDVSSLLDTYSLSDIEQMLANPGKVLTAINDHVRKLYKDPNKDFYIRMSKDLGFYLVTDRVANAHLLRNAHNIAKGFGAGFSRPITDTHAARVEPIINRLATLYALTHVNAQKKASISQLMRTEAARSDGGNGIKYTLLMHSNLQKQSEERLFKESKAMMIKGYTPQLYNEGTEIAIADAVKGQALLDQGWVQGAQVTLDSADPDQTIKHIYVLKDRGLRRFVSGVVSNTGTNARGTSKHGNIIDPLDGSINPWARNAHVKIKHRKKSAIRDLHLPNNHYRPDSDLKGNHLVPIFNPDGEVVNYNYLMNAQTKNTLLDRDLSFSTILGAFDSSIFDKESSVVQNRKVIEVLKQQFDAEGANKPHSYVEISDASTDDEMKEFWDILPKATKQIVKEVWGNQPLKVRSDLVYPVFGFRKRSISQPWDKPVTQRTANEKLYTKMIEGICRVLGKNPNRAGIHVRQFEDLWQEIVAETKDILVVKTGVTLFWNMVSNITQLWWIGLSPIAIVQHTRTALTGAIEYRAESKELQRLKSMKDAGYGNQKDLDQAIIRLEDSIARNPARELIEAGLLPTIVEDVSLDEDPYSYKSKLQEATKKYTKRIPTFVKTGARYAYMTHDTPLYKVLSQGTQLSDFVARYALYQHLTTREDAPMAKQDAIRKASDVFVNYDVPTHPTVQYLNDSGAVMFTKYYTRIQRTLLEQWKENPARALILMVGADYLDGMQTILDAGGFHNPLEPGAFKMFEAWDEGLMLNLTGSLLSTD